MSLKRAASELHVTPAAVSHQVKLLEDYLGVALFKRLNRGLRLTPVARAALPKLREGFEALAEAAQRMKPESADAGLTVSVAPSFAARWLMPRLHRFFSAHPDIDVRVSARTRLNRKLTPEDGEEQASIERWLEESDIAVPYGHGNYPDYQVDKLLSVTLAPMCSPRLAAGPVPLRNPGDLSEHTLVHDDTGMQYQGVSFWDTWLHAAGVTGVDTTRGPHFSHPELAIEAACDSIGVVATLPVLAASELAEGRLVMPFELQVPLESAYYLVCDAAAANRPTVLAFRDWLLAEAGKQGVKEQKGG